MERSTLRVTRVVLLASALVWVGAGVASATDVLMPGRYLVLRDTDSLTIVAKPKIGTTFPLPIAGGPADPVVNPSSLSVFDTDATGVLSDPLTAGRWTRLGTPPGSSGYRYLNRGADAAHPVRTITIRSSVVEVIAKDDGTLNGPLEGNAALVLSTGVDRRCAEFGGRSVANEEGYVVRRNSPAPGACYEPPPPCCNGKGFFGFRSVKAPGDCGDIQDATGMLVANLACSGLHLGGGGCSYQQPTSLPWIGDSVGRITSCVGEAATLSATTSSQTGSDRNCTSSGCRIGAPFAVLNPLSPPWSLCLVPSVAADAMGSLDCGSGAASLDLPISSVVYLTGDSVSTIAGTQPCPLCSGGTCIGGPNNGMACVPGSAAGDAPYPTSHDCPPDAWMANGSLPPFAFALSTGTVTWTGTAATNDSGSTASSQTRVFSGYCRDVSLPGGTGSFDADPAPGNQSKHCWENGMAVGGACSEANNSAESCEQRTTGAFGPNGGANRTVRAIGTSFSNLLGGAASGTLVSIFSVPPMFDATFDGSIDLPGPGAVAIPGTLRLCDAANACP